MIQRNVSLYFFVSEIWKFMRANHRRSKYLISHRKQLDELRECYSFKSNACYYYYKIHRSDVRRKLFHTSDGRSIFHMQINSAPVMRQTFVVADKIKIIRAIVACVSYLSWSSTRSRREIIPNAQQETHFSRETRPSHGHGRLNERIRNRRMRRLLRPESETRDYENARARDGSIYVYMYVLYKAGMREIKHNVYIPSFRLRDDKKCLLLLRVRLFRSFWIFIRAVRQGVGPREKQTRVHFHFRVTELSLPDWREEIL